MKNRHIVIPLVTAVVLLVALNVFLHFLRLSFDSSDTAKIVSFIIAILGGWVIGKLADGLYLEMRPEKEDYYG